MQRRKAGKAATRRGIFNYDTAAPAPEDDAEIEAELFNRLVASAAGLARVCVLKKCRRRKRCMGDVPGDLLCKRHHMGLGQARFESALKVLGWPNCNDDGTRIARPAKEARRR